MADIPVYISWSQNDPAIPVTIKYKKCTDTSWTTPLSGNPTTGESFTLELDEFTCYDIHLTFDNGTCRPNCVEIQIVTCNSDTTMSTTTTTTETFPPPNVQISSSLGGTSIPQVGGIVGISGFTLPESVEAGENIIGYHDPFTGIIQVSVTGSPVVTGNLRLYKNFVELECITVPAAGVYAFGSQAFSGTDHVRVSLSTGACS